MTTTACRHAPHGRRHKWLDAGTSGAGLRFEACTWCGAYAVTLPDGTRYEDDDDDEGDQDRRTG